MSSADELFEDLPEQVAPVAVQRGGARLRQPERHQVGWHSAALDDLVAPDHPVRAVWAFALVLDLRELHDAVKAREGVPGHPPPSPEVMMALWLWAVVDGVGSARQVARLCEEHVAYRWLCGGVSMNYHGLSDFRVAHVEVLDRLLARGVAALVAEGLVALDVLAQDGMKVRASAGASSFRRRKRLEQLGELEAERARREKTNKAQTAKQKEPRASTTDAEARVMKMADGGFRPAYNMQIVAEPKSQVIVAVDIDTSGSDRGLARPAIEALHARDCRPFDYLVDGGFTKNDDIEWAHATGTTLWCPPGHTKHGTDPYAPKPGDSAAVADWRKRMASDLGKKLYRRRAEHECINAYGRRMGLQQLTIRGKDKARTVLLWFALAHNMLRSFALGAAAQVPA